jgi:hypothetical protein
LNPLMKELLGKFSSATELRIATLFQSHRNFSDVLLCVGIMPCYRYVG